MAAKAIDQLVGKPGATLADNLTRLTMVEKALTQLDDRGQMVISELNGSLNFIATWGDPSVGGILIFFSMKRPKIGMHH